MMKIDYDPDEPKLGYSIYDDDQLTLLRVGRKFQDWLDGIGRMGELVEVTFCTFYRTGLNCVSIIPYPIVNEKGLKEIKNKVYEIAVGAEWNPLTRKLIPK